MARGHKPTKKGNPPPPNEYSEDDPTSVYDSGEHRPRAQSSPGAASSSGDLPTAASSSGDLPAAPKIHAISMKTPADPRLKPVEKPEREMPHVKLRAMSDIARAQQPQNLGNLASPYDPRQARARGMKELVLWGCLTVVLASGIALIVWFVAG